MCWMWRTSSANPALAFTDCREGSGWRHTCFTDESYRAHMPALGLTLPLLLLLVVVLRLECITIDYLHAFDLGFGSHVVGNVFWETVTRRVWGKTNQEDNTTEWKRTLTNGARRIK